MSKLTELMLMYSDGELDIEKALKVEKTILKDKRLKEEYLLNKRIDEFMQAQLMVEQINQEEQLVEIDAEAKNLVSEFYEGGNGSNETYAFFINGALLQNKKLEKQIDEAEREMYSKNIKEQTRAWVKSWEEQKNNLVEHDEYTMEIFDFVKRGMESDTTLKPLITSKINTRKLIYRISAVAAVLILALGIWTLFNLPTSPQELYTSYYEPYPVIDGQTRSTEQSVNDLFKEGVKFYKNEQFADAALLFDKLLSVNKNSLKIQLLYGITQMELNNYKEAIDYFSGIVESKAEYVIEAKWYLALCYLRTGELVKSKELFKELAETPGIYQEKSIELLNKL